VEDDSFYLDLIPDGELVSFPNASPTQGDDDSPDQPCYLFILPPPWCQDQSCYYWSVDPHGESVMSEEQRTLLGFPSFTESFFTHCLNYRAEVYDFIQQWQKAKGFDPTTTDFARSMGLPIFEMLPQDEDRFRSLTEDDDGMHNVQLFTSLGLITIHPATAFEMQESLEYMDVDVDVQCMVVDE
ncbi:hypothetical protein V5O48_010758, partial [Marasmius crinis-equi]